MVRPVLAGKPGGHAGSGLGRPSAFSRSAGGSISPGSARTVAGGGRMKKATVSGRGYFSLLVLSMLGSVSLIGGGQRRGTGYLDHHFIGRPFVSSPCYFAPISASRERSVEGVFSRCAGKVVGRLFCLFYGLTAWYLASRHHRGLCVLPVGNHLVGHAPACTGPDDGLHPLLYGPGGLRRSGADRRNAAAHCDGLCAFVGAGHPTPV